MKAIALTKYGTGKDLDLIDREVPVAKAQEVLIRVHAAAVNLIDLKKAAGAFKDFMPLSFPWIPGVDFSGIVESVGQGITDYQAGDEVYGAKMEGGTYAEYLTIDAAFIALKPRRLSFAEAASVPVAAETAWQVLRHANIGKGQTVLVHGGAGAVGAYAVQLAHRAGARVLTTAAAADKAFLQSLGADEVIDYKTGVFEDVVRNVDAVIDTVGGEVLQRSYAVIKQGGYLISLTQPISEPLAAQYEIHALFSQLQPAHAELEEIAQLIDGGQLKTGLGNVYALQQAAAAWDELSGAPTLTMQPKKGRVVLSMPLSDEVQQNIAFAEFLGLPTINQYPPAETRERIKQLPPYPNPTPVAEIVNTIIPTGEIPVRIYIPKGEGPFAIVAYFHGGGFTIMSIDAVDEICRELCARAGVIIMSVEYRLAPEHPYPAGPDDCITATKWMIENAGKYRGVGGRAAVAGDSAGGYMAAYTAQQLTKEGVQLAAQFLAYPVTDHYSGRHASWEENKVGFGLTAEAMKWFWDNYLTDPSLFDEASPLRAKSFAGLPPALIITCTYDPLRDEGRAYAEKLGAAGVPVVYKNYENVHGFLGAGASGQEAIQFASNFLKDKLA
jgi:acetyl esterase